MKPYISYPKLCLLQVALSMATLPVAHAANNRKPVAQAGADQAVGFSAPVTLDGQLSSAPNSSIKKYQWTQVSGIQVSLTPVKPAIVSFKAPAIGKNKKPLKLVFRLAVTNNQNSVATDTVAVYVIASKLNDTGITFCSNGNSNTHCPNNSHPGQDGQYGRDKTANNDNDGHAGFSFTKISSTGKILPANAANWSCVQDNITGLIWEIKTDDGGLHDQNWTYSWFEPNKNINGDDKGYAKGGRCGAKSACDTAGFVRAVNKAGWCGAKDWRLPKKSELYSLVDYSQPAPTIDGEYFPNTLAKAFWTSTYAISFYGARSVDFRDGSSKAFAKNNTFPVMLVRGGK